LFFLNRHCRNLLALPVVLFFLPQIVISQPDSLWSRTYGGIRRDLINCTRQTSDGGFISTGFYSIFWSEQDLISPDLWLLKTNSQGDIEWNRLYGISGNEAGYWVEQTSEGGYIVGGSIFEQGTGERLLAMKTDENGDEEWLYSYYNPLGCSYCKCIKETFDGGYILATEFETILKDIVLIKLDSLGQEEWLKYYNGASFSWDTPTYIEQTPDSGYIVTGSFSDFNSGQSSLFLLKIDESGEEEWCNYYGGDYYFSGECVHHLDGNGYIATGKYWSSYSGYDLWLLRTDEMGDTIWSKRFGGTDNDMGYNVEITSDSCFFATGYTFSMGAGEEDVYAVKVNMAGQLLWQRTFGGSERDIAFCGTQLDDNGYIISGYTYSFSEGPLYDGWIIRLESDLGIEEAPHTEDKLSLSTYPSPFSSILSLDLLLPSNADISVKVFDPTGRLIDTVFQGAMPRGTNTLQWIPHENTPSGCYLVYLQSGIHSATDKCILLR